MSGNYTRTSTMDTEERPCYLALTKERRLTLFDGKRKYLYISFRLFRRLDRFQWVGLEFNRYRFGDHCDSYLDLSLFSRQLVIGIHCGTYDESVNAYTGG